MTDLPITAAQLAKLEAKLDATDKALREAIAARDSEEIKELRAKLVAIEEQIAKGRKSKKPRYRPAPASKPASKPDDDDEEEDDDEDDGGDDDSDDFDDDY